MTSKSSFLWSLGILIVHASAQIALSSEALYGDRRLEATTGMADVTLPDDTITMIGSSSPRGEEVENAIDNSGQKYVNLQKQNAGLIVSPSRGWTRVTGVKLYQANDWENRDPTSFILEGSQCIEADEWTPISEGVVSLSEERNGKSASLTHSTEVNFDNTEYYRSYRLTFPTIKDGTAPSPTANAFQIAEIELPGLVYDQESCGQLIAGDVWNPYMSTCVPRGEDLLIFDRDYWSNGCFYWLNQHCFEVGQQWQITAQLSLMDHQFQPTDCNVTAGVSSPNACPVFRVLARTILPDGSDGGYDSVYVENESGADAWSTSGLNDFTGTFTVTEGLICHAWTKLIVMGPAAGIQVHAQAVSLTRVP